MLSIAFDCSGSPQCLLLLFECHLVALGNVWPELLNKLFGKYRTSFPKLSFLNFVPSVLIQAIPDGILYSVLIVFTNAALAERKC